MTGELRDELGAENDVLTPALLLELMREDFGVDPQLTDQEARLVVGVLYELRLRSSGITYSAYTFAEDVPVELISLVNEESEEGWIDGRRWLARSGNRGREGGSGGIPMKMLSGWRRG